jgi:hypothetical protein
MGVIVAVAGCAPQVKVGKTRVEDELEDDDQSNKGRAEGDGNMSTCHSSWPSVLEAEAGVAETAEAADR